MENKVIEIRDIILEDIDPEAICILNMGPITLIVVVWNKLLNNFEKRVHLRRLLKFINVPFDIIVYSTDELEKVIQDKNSITYEIITRGKLLYKKNEMTLS